ncbi:hypothetical protein [Nocardia fluminea]|uniref:Uncharacterized protein n=1 Tax=Nocardia fluminea TaxID=134984 RepID=A0A2N3V5A4_9NOCA|nr:hypothetical protein [Nocardia fluminea]PKV76809.1 hypothetical protein ATK86_7213 [Nocardia fluminea]
MTHISRQSRQLHQADTSTEVTTTAGDSLAASNIGSDHAGDAAPLKKTFAAAAAGRLFGASAEHALAQVWEWLTS